MITVISTGISNVHSVRNMLVRIGCEVRISEDPLQVASSDKLILPGVGAFDAGMKALAASGLGEAIHEAVRERRASLLGICLGMQLLLEGSEEGSLQGLSLVTGYAKRFRFDKPGLRVPHMGWNTVRWSRPSPIRPGTEDDHRYYFVHSYYADCADPADVVGSTAHGGDFASVFQRGRVFGVQFHPEKSHRFGMMLLTRYAQS